jgi:hypothetical protein
MNQRQLLFCQLYTSSVSFGNAYKSYVQAYSVDQSDGQKRQGARRSASRLLSNVDIVEECNRLLKEACRKEVVNIELGYLIRQRKDLAAKVSAIKLYNQLNERLEAKVVHGVVYI